MKIPFRLPLFITTALIFFISSCSKNNSSSSGNTVVLPDTLTAGWTKSNPLPPEKFTDIFFPDNSTGYTIGVSGLYKSVNGGDEWNLINPATNLFHLAAGNTNNVCIVDNAFLVLATQDGGNTFVNSTYPSVGGGSVGFFSCSFADPATCYFGSNQFLWKSIDAGVTIDTTYRFTNLSSTNTLFFINNMQGWILRQDGIYQTSDGGDSWNLDTALVNGYGSIQFIDPDNGYSSDYGTINKSTNGGITWAPVYQFPFETYVDIHFIDLNEGYCSQGARIYKTTDGGVSWTAVVLLGNEQVTKMYFRDINHGWACTSAGAILKFTQ